MLSLLNNYRRYQHNYHYGLILLLAFSRVVTSNVLSCPPDFDCNAYLQMVDNWLYQPQIAGHHAMRILPPIIVKLFTLLGISKVHGFYLLSSFTYCAFGALVYYFFKTHNVYPQQMVFRVGAECSKRRSVYEIHDCGESHEGNTTENSSVKGINPQLALCLSLLCLAPHAAMRIPLQLVYQSCDMIVYPLVLLIFMYSLRQNALAVFALGLSGLLVRQNLFVMSLFSLLFCWTKKRELLTLGYAALTVGCYLLLQNYFQANETFRQLLSPPEGYFTVNHLAWVFWDSKLLELLVPALPLILWHIKPLIQWFWRNWHLSAYMCITIGQPFLAYHMTGNNFPRLALQGFWPIYLALGCVYLSKLQNKRLLGILFIYALSIYFTWGIEQRIYMAGLLTVILLSEQLWRWSVSRMVGARI